ncbi:AgmX/PglI C-terminal domain-containing protein [Persicimonas caeni]|nr:AgmX/PglI C-terminal domain-containing protein [Persicimonas caeni]
MLHRRLIPSLLGVVLALGLASCIQPTEYELREWVEYPHTIVDPEEPKPRADERLEADVDASMAEAAQVVGPGQLDAAEIDELFDARTEVVLACYRQELRANGSAEGALTLQFVVPPAGYAEQVRVVDNSVGEVAGSCVADAVRGWALPAPDAESVTVRKAIEFYIESP